MNAASLNLVLASNVRRVRHRRGWSQEELSARCRLHRTYIGAIERGERNITLKTLEHLAEALGVDPLDLLRDGNDG